MWTYQRVSKSAKRVLNKYKSNVQKDEFTVSVYSGTVVKRKHDGNGSD